MHDAPQVLTLLDAAAVIRRAGSIEAILERLVDQARLTIDAVALQAEARFADQPIATAAWGDAPAESAPLEVPLQAAGEKHGVLTIWPVADAGEIDVIPLTILCHGAAAGLREVEGIDPSDAGSGTMLAMVAHDIRGPLTSILGFAETLRARDDGADSTRAHFLGTIAAQARRISRLVDNVHTLQRERGRFVPARAPVPVAQVIGEAIAEVDVGEAEHRDEFRIDVPADLEAEVDGMLLYQAVANLAWNAITHGRPPVVVSAECVEECLRVSVEDAGSGVPDERQPMLFTPFVEGAVGTGLGLSIVAAVAAAHNGRARYESAPSGGARFVIELALR